MPKMINPKLLQKLENTKQRLQNPEDSQICMQSDSEPLESVDPGTKCSESAQAKHLELQEQLIDYKDLIEDP